MKSVKDAEINLLSEQPASAIPEPALPSQSLVNMAASMTMDEHENTVERMETNSQSGSLAGNGSKNVEEIPNKATKTSVSQNLTNTTQMKLLGDNQKDISSKTLICSIIGKNIPAAQKGCLPVEPNKSTIKNQTCSRKTMAVNRVQPTQRTLAAKSPTYDQVPTNLDQMNHILFLDLDNWPKFFQKLPRPLPNGTFVWAFCGGTNVWKEPVR
jgi:hypothetical protein